MDNQFDIVNEEILKLLELILSIPLTSALTECSMSTLKRIKIYLHNVKKNKRLSQLITLSIGKGLTFMCTKDVTFKGKVIDIFAD